MLILAFILIVLGLSFSLTFYFRHFALEKSIIDIPNERSSHDQPTPRGGGVVFVGLFYLVLCALWCMKQITTPVSLAFLGGIPIALIGYLDDIKGVKIYWRFLVHLASATWSVAMLGILHSFSAIIPIVIIVSLINFYNFMDGIDGIAATQGIFLSSVAGFILLMKNHLGMSLLSFGLLASLTGFLYWNWQPAKIFMGDIGSGFLGYFFGTLMFSTAVQYKIPVMFWFILMGIFLCDAGCTLLYRMMKKKKWYLAHREHVYQRLVQSGFEHFQVTLFVLLINVFLLLPAALLFLDLQSVIARMLLSFVLIVVFGISWLFSHRKFSA